MLNTKMKLLEDDFPLQLGDFQVPAVHFPGWNDYFPIEIA